MNKILPGITYQGKISVFGGPKDAGVSPTEGLALYNTIEENPEFFLPEAPPLLENDKKYPGVCAVTGLARRLNPTKLYCAMRWDYTACPKSVLRISEVLITYGTRRIKAKPVDWGPAEWTTRLIDVSEGVMEGLGLDPEKDTDKIVKAYLMEQKFA